MGQDIIVVAENKNKVSIKDFEKLLEAGNYPGGRGTFSEDTEFGDGYELSDPEYAYHFIQFIEGHVAVHDGCRYGDDSTYQFNLAKIVEQLSGGSIEIISDAMQVEDYLFFKNKNSE